MSLTFGDIGYEKLYLVRVQGGLDGMVAAGDALILSRTGSGRAEDMNTFHFSINGIVSNHVMGTQFNASEYVIVTPLVDACRDAGNIPSGLNPVDTYFHAAPDGTMKLPQAILAVPEDAVIPESLQPLARRYPRGATPEETMLNRDNAVREIFAELDAPMHVVGPHYWTDCPDISSGDKKKSCAAPMRKP